MFPNEVFAQYKELCSDIAKQSKEYKKENASGLFAILSELQRSLALELSIIQQVRRMSVGDKDGVKEFTWKFEDYIQQREYNLERSSCSRISRILDTQISSLRGGTPSDQDKMNELEQLLRRFVGADNGFVEEIEPIMKSALAAVQEINAYVQEGHISEARQRQNDFVSEYMVRFKQLKDAIQKIRKIGDTLLDQM